MNLYRGVYSCLAIFQSDVTSDLIKAAFTTTDAYNCLCRFMSLKFYIGVMNTGL